MGNSCTHAADSVAHLVTKDEIQEAVKCIDEWQKTQQAVAKGANTAQNAYGPLLQRVGGLDVVKQVVELFYRKLYADSRLITFLHDQDVMHLRAKQSAFVSWLFGPPNVPYVGRSVRIAHLRIIKERGFGPEDFDLGMRYFEEAMRELGAPEAIMGEVMRRMLPFKDAFFTPSAKDAEEEARWVSADRVKEEDEARQHQAAELEQQQQEQARQLHQQITLVQRAAHDAALAAAAAAGAAATVTEVVAVVEVAEGAVDPPRPASRPASRGPQCPFTGGRISRPASAAAAAAPPPPPPAAAAAAAGSAATAAAPPAGPQTADPTPLPGMASPNPATYVAAPTSAPTPAPAPAVAVAAIAVAAGGESRPGTRSSGSRIPAAPAARLASPTAALPPPPPPVPVAAAAPAPAPAVAAAAPPAPAPPPPPSAPNPMSDFDALLGELEQAIRQSESSGQRTPLLGATAAVF